MKKSTFGSPSIYKSLEYITEKIDSLEPKHQKYIGTLITEFHTHLNDVQTINNDKFKKYISLLIYNDYIQRIDKYMHFENYGKLINYLKNYFKARIKNLEK